VQTGPLPEPLFRHLGVIPHLREGFERFLVACRDPLHLSALTLERCRHAIAAQLGLPPGALGPPLADLGPEEAAAIAAGLTPAGLPEPDRTALAVARLMPFQHHDITDEQVATLRSHLGETGTVSLLATLAMFDAVGRMTAVAIPQQEVR